MRKIWGYRFFICFLVALIIVQPSLPGVVLANTDTAVGRTNLLIDFFRQNQTNLAINQLNKNEVIVYGVFLSNFFTPGKTRIKDLIDATSDKTIAKDLSKKFFGSDGNANTILELNKLLYNAITDVLKGQSRNTYALYAKNPNNNPSMSPMSGEDLINKFMGRGDSGSDPRIYNFRGGVVMDLSPEKKVGRGVFQILFGFLPEWVVGKKGIRSMDALYMDGLGNIWGSYKKNGTAVPIDEYVLVLPAALNPAVFEDRVEKQKLPLTNVFAMGGILKITEDYLVNEDDIMFPYYNIRKAFTSGEVNSNSWLNANNLVTIFGIQTPKGKFTLSNGQTYDAIGNSDIVINNLDKVMTNPADSLEQYLNATTGSTFSKDDAFVLLSVDINKFPDFEDLVADEGWNNEDKVNLTAYLFGTTVFSMDEIVDYMYYFDLSGVGASGDGGTWFKSNDVTPLVSRQKLFAREVESPRGNEFSLYNGSYFSSPFNRFLLEYNEAKNAGNEDQYLLKVLQEKFDKEVSPSSEEFKALKLFLNDGLFSLDKNTVDGDLARKALRLLVKKNKKYNILDVLPRSTLVNNVKLSYLININFIINLRLFPTKASSLAFALTPRDSLLTDYSASGKDLYFSDTLTRQHQNGLATLFYAALVYRIFSMNSVFINGATPESGFTPNSKIEGILGEYKVKTAVLNGVNNYPGIYWGYMMELLNVNPRVNDDGTIDWGIVGYQNEVLPFLPLPLQGGFLDLNTALNTTGVVSSEDRTLEEMQLDIVRKVYGLLSEGTSTTREKLVKSFQDSWVISTHRSLVGSWVGNVLSVSSGGNATYSSVVGYINTPSLSEIPFTSWIVQDYVYVYMFFFLIILIIVIVMVLSNVRTLREGLMILLLMAFVLILPNFLVSNVIAISNMAGDKIYSSRFNYWAITQHEQVLSTLRGTTFTGDDFNRVIAENMQAARNMYSSDAGVRVKWPAPKREDVFDTLFSRDSSKQSLSSYMTIFRWLFNSFFTQQEYVYNDPLATYVYRPYNAIAQEASSTYTKLSSTAVDLKDIASKIKSLEGKVLLLPEERFALFHNPDGIIEYSDDRKELIDRVSTYPGSTTEDFKKRLNRYRFWHMGYDPLTEAIFKSDYSMDPTQVGVDENLDNAYYKMFTLMTESPFYYFYNVFKTRYSEEGSLIPGGFKSALLTEEVFKVNDRNNPEVNNKLRDFLDLEGLFTYVIPYLHQANEYVIGWISTYGTSVDGYNFDPKAMPDNKDLTVRYMDEMNKKEALKRVWRLYSPWVDLLYEGALNQKIKVAGKTKYVGDALNPAFYQVQGRDMIFSEADMAAKSYRYSDLSDVERKIQAVLASTYKDLMYLTNYRDFREETLITAAAMMATFNFNREFSDIKLLGESVILYPQSFELKNFNYDAFLRLLLLNSTGEPLMADKDLYVRVLDKTSFFTGILLIISDVLAVIVIPAAKIIVLVLLLLLSLTICLSGVVSKPDRIVRFVLKHIGLPAGVFLLANIVFAFVVSLFLGEGLTGYVGSRYPVLVVTDPTIMLLILIVVDLIYVYVLWKVIKLLFDSFKQYVLSSVHGAVALIAGAGATLVAKVRDLSESRKVGFAQESKGAEVPVSSARKTDRGSSIDEDGLRSVAARIEKENNTPKVDKEFVKYVDDLADRRVEPEETEKSSYDSYYVRRTIGNRVVDFKHSVKSSWRDFTDSITSTKDRIHESLLDARLRMSRYRTSMMVNEVGKLGESIARQQLSKEAIDARAQKRVEKDYKKFNDLNEKIKARVQREMLLEQKKKNLRAKLKSSDNNKSGKGDPQ